MKKYLNYFYLAAVSSIVLMSCDDIFEEDISSDVITPIAPTANSIFEGNLVQFRWNTIEGAEEYRIQITTEQDQILLLDSLVPATVFDFTLDSGVYQWRVRGENFGYQSPYTFPISFTTTASEDLGKQKVDLQKPDPDVATKTPNAILFSWKGIETATSYTFELLSISNGVETSVKKLTDLTVLETQLEAGTITEDGTYKWRVQAFNSANTTQTEFSSRNFVVDTQNPAVPNVLLPVADATTNVNQEVSFSWEFPEAETEGTPVQSILELASDAAFASLVQEAVTLDTTSYNYTPSTSGDLYWRVKGIDQAGNESSFSEGRKLTVN